jgi:hypothetical protein
MKEMTLEDVPGLRAGLKVGVRVLDKFREEGQMSDVQRHKITAALGYLDLAAFVLSDWEKSGDPAPLC